MGAPVADWNPTRVSLPKKGRPSVGALLRVESNEDVFAKEGAPTEGRPYMGLFLVD